MSITTKDLAKVCGVSRTTVTRALSGTGRISEETKNRILNMAKELDYQPDLLARSLVKGGSMTIGVVLCDLKNMFFPSVIDAMERVARDNGYLLNITLHDNSKILEENIITQLAGHKIDGLLLDPASREKAHYDYLKKLPFPVVIIGGDRLEDLSLFGNNEFEAADSAARFIAAKGYHSLHFVFPGFEGKEADFYGGHRERLNGAQAAAAGCNMIFSVLGDHDYMEQAARITAAAKNAGEKPAFLCSGDIYAGYIILNLQKKGFTAGVDYGIMGFDRLDLMQMLPISLASVENNVEQIGNEAIGLLLDMIENDRKKQTIYVPYQIIDGTSL